MSIIGGYNQRKLKRAALLNRILSVVFKPFCRHSKKRVESPISNPKKILLVQSHLIGDLVMATPMLLALRKAYPDAKISLLANGFAEVLLAGSSMVDKIINIKFPWSMHDYSFKNLAGILKTVKKLRREKFDLAIDAQIDMRNAFLMFLTGARRRLGYDITGGGIFLTDIPEFPDGKDNLLDARLSVLKHLGVDCSNRKTELSIGDKADEWAESYLQQNNLEENLVIAIHPGASVREKLWQPEKFAKVIGFLHSRGYQPVVIEGPDDRDIVISVISLTHVRPPIVKIGLGNVVAFIKRCRLMICLDSAAVHLAAAVGTPVVAIYGPHPPKLTKPFGDNIEILWDENFECRPCEYGHCKNPKHSCMAAIPADAVIQEIDQQLNHKIANHLEKDFV